MGFSKLRSSRTRTVAGKVTAEEEARIKAYAAERGYDVSTLTRALWLGELRRHSRGGRRNASVEMLRLFTRTMEASLELGEYFTVDRFRALCAEVKADGGNGRK
ncbi:MAG: hypothetical protein JO300_05970 [Silvibacterium sp.]|nr:hypothetical protein [Silvibacterium sp.]